MTKEDLKEHVVAAIDKTREEIIAIGEDILRHPELGFKEQRTTSVVANRLRELGLEVREGLAITGAAGVLDTGRAGPNVCVMGELDSVLCPGHPYADPVTGAAHACGHNAQVASVIGAAMGLVLSGAKNYLSGRITFLGVPAEEYVEIEWRQALRRKGTIRFLGGKQELIARGFFDDVDMAMMVHLAGLSDDKVVTIGESSNGFIGKLVRYRGKEAHAGAAPHMGINALNAAILGLIGVSMLRETWKDEDHVRVHPIITKGGDIVNVIPADVRIESYVRASSIEAMIDANSKVNRAFFAGAMAIGAEVTVEDLPGYLPRIPAPALAEVFRANAEDMVGPSRVSEGGYSAGSSDIGDLSHIMPAIHPSVGGAKGSAHSENFLVDDPETAYVLPAKLLAATVIDLLWDDASTGRRIVEEFRPALTREEYLSTWEKILSRTR
ncbi:MAG: amidohydrolase [Firmicutes bacterium]|nr:amidohydrolase [Candidatus Fermentithermobacillaceae bacterium]